MKVLQATRGRGARRPPASLILVTVCLAALMMPLCFTGPAVALVAIRQQLPGTPVELAWVTNAFMLGFGSSLMAAGAMADRYGRKRLFVGGLLAFTVLSLGMVAVPGLALFNLLRGLQGVACACAFSGGVAALAQVYDGPSRVRAFSFLGTSFGVGLAFGPFLSGALVEALGWPSIFVGLAVVGAAALSAGIRWVPESRDHSAGAFDWLGAASFTAALFLLTYGILEVPARGWDDGQVRTMLIAAVLAIVIFIAVERRVTRPMLDLSLFRIPRFVGVQLLAAAPAYSYVVLLILLPLRFVGIEGYGEQAGGRMMIALSLPMLVVPLCAGLLVRRFSAASVCALGLAICAVGLCWLGRVPVGSSALALVPPLLLIGGGMGLPWGLMDGLAVSTVPVEQAGVAAGIFSTVRVAGEGIALAVVSALLAGLIESSLPVRDGAAGAALRMASGDLHGAVGLLPGLHRATLVAVYGEAFGSLMQILAGITVLTALAIFVMLGRGEPRSAAVIEPAMKER